MQIEYSKLNSYEIKQNFLNSDYYKVVYPKYDTQLKSVSFTSLSRPIIDSTSCRLQTRNWK